MYIIVLCIASFCIQLYHVLSYVYCTLGKGLIESEFSLVVFSLPGKLTCMHCVSGTVNRQVFVWIFLGSFFF